MHRIGGQRIGVSFGYIIHATEIYTKKCCQIWAREDIVNSTDWSWQLPIDLQTFCGIHAISALPNQWVVPNINVMIEDSTEYHRREKYYS